MHIYPNPTSNLITFGQNFRGSKIEIYDSNGRIVRKTTLDNSNNLNIEDLQNGIYLIVLDNKRIIKIIKGWNNTFANNVYSS